MQGEAHPRARVALTGSLCTQMCVVLSLHCPGWVLTATTWRLSTGNVTSTAEGSVLLHFHSFQTK